MATLNLKPTHQAVRAYYEELRTLSNLDFYAEGAVSPAFAALLRHCAKQGRLTLVEQYPFKKNGRTLRIDGALLDSFKLPLGYWEAKDTADDLQKEIQKKFAAGYPKDNIFFQAPHRAIIYQHGREFFNEDISQPDKLVEALKLFFAYQPPEFENWQKAVQEFKDRLPQLAQSFLELIVQEQGRNPAFAAAFGEFADLCRQALNPNLSTQAVEEMIIQHLLTERLFRKVFDDPDFVNKNIIAREIEKVIAALTSRHFSRQEFLRPLDRFYLAIESAAALMDDFSQKQTFLNTVYERFFQGFSVKVADTHGIVYTPQPIVEFMVRSVDELLHREFGRSLADAGVHILDPFVGTGNFLVRLMREIPKTRLEAKYAGELHANEVMLLPYYIASMNIEHCFYELAGQYRPFEGICLVDTFELAEAKQPSLFTEKNLERVERQRQTPIFVILGNPPYNAGQVNENDNNRNRRYPVIDGRVSETYGKASKATLVRKLNDPYVKAIRWATDRLKGEGIIAFITNSSFITEITFDGMRKHLGQDFDTIYVLDLGGNVRKNPKLSGSTHNVFGVQVGVSISFFVRKKERSTTDPRIFYASVGHDWSKEQKYNFLDKQGNYENIDWQKIKPDENYNWLQEGLLEEFESFLPIGTKLARFGKQQAIFQKYSLGVATNRDVWTYNFDISYLSYNITKLLDNYDTCLSKWDRLAKKTHIDEFASNYAISWTYRLKNYIEQNVTIEYNTASLRTAIYRPFVKQKLYFDKFLITPSV